MDTIKMTFIGCGAMGEAILAAILNRGLSMPQAVWASDIKQERRHYLKQTYDISTTDNNAEAAEYGDIIILAIKPQTLPELLPELKGRIRTGQLVLSIVAGARIGTLCKGINHHQVVRAMPNTPAQIGQGISVWTATQEVTDKQKEQAKAILSGMGREIYVADEGYIDMATAVSGSGPAYFFFFVECIIEAATKLGFSEDTAHELVLQTMLGSGQLLNKSDKSPAELRCLVTSPGGTTAAALQQFEDGGFRELINEAVSAAYRRAGELGK